MKKVLILGAGMVVKPMVEFLLENNFSLLVATTTKEKADRMIKGHPNGYSLRWSADDSVTLEKLVNEHDITVSFLPYRYHVHIAKVCLKYKKPLVTTSYVQPEMQALDQTARDSGVLLLNETGLDPGIDHMTAMKVIDYIHAKNGKVEEFYSLCGALPAPESADNPLAYKFSWSPKGVVQAGMNSGLYLKRGKIVSVPSENLFKDRFIQNFPGLGELEVYPNRDSTSYIGIYGIPETSTMYRGTFRYKGWCETLDAIKSLKMLDNTAKDYRNMSYAGFLAERSGLSISGLRDKLAAKMGWDDNSVPLRSLEFLGFFSDELLHYEGTTPFEITSDRMISRMSLSENDRDAVMMQHIFMASYTDGTREVIKSSLLDFGSPATNTAVARTVALPAAIAVKMILDKRINLCGVYRPVVKEIYIPVLQELSMLGIEMKEEYGLPGSTSLPS